MKPDRLAKARLRMRTLREAGSCIGCGIEVTGKTRCRPCGQKAAAIDARRRTTLKVLLARIEVLEAQIRSIQMSLPKGIPQ